MGLNNVCVKGRMVGNVKMLDSGKAGTFTIAINDDYKDNKRTYFVDCIAFGKTAEVIDKWFRKGKEIIVTGKIQQSVWEKDGNKYSKVGIAVNGFDFCGKAEGSKGESDESDLPDLEEPSFSSSNYEDDNLPF